MASQSSLSRKLLPLVSAGLLATLTCVASAQASASNVPQNTDPRYRDASLSPEERARDLVSRMTLDEKIGQIPNHAAAIPRLDVPEYDYWSEGLHGLARAGYATVFPQAIGMAATWDQDLIHSEGQTIAREARLKYGQAREANHPSIYFGLDLWSPNINIFRDPRWGRGQETYGEDPLLTASIGSSFVRGLQGDDPAHPTVIATPKHFAVHSGPEADRHSFNVPVSAHDLEDTYLPAFRAAIVEAHAQSIMCAYNAIDGQPACASELLLKQRLRGDWHFTGYVTSDCGAIDDISAGHKFVADRASASAISLRDGTDTACGNTSTEAAALQQAVQRNLASEADVDRAVIRLFTARFRLGMFDAQPPLPRNQRPDNALALRAAHESIVLLKNNGVLPLSSSTQTVAIIGPNASNLSALEGNYSGVIASPKFLPDADFTSDDVTRRVVYAQGSSLADRFFIPVPRSIFRTPSGDPGLNAVYTDDSPAPGNAPALHRIDRQIDFNWNGASPFTQEMTRPAQAFTAEWKGSIVPPSAGDYTFKVQQSHCFPCDDTEHYTVIVDGKTIAEAGLPPAARDRIAEFTLHFADRTPKTVDITYSHHSPLFGASITLAWLPPAQALRAEAVEVAKSADVVIACVGLSPLLEGEEMKVDVDGFSGGDRTRIELPQTQLDLLDALAATGKPLVVVLMNGSALSLEGARTHAAAIVEAWYPGQQGSQAIADVLKGTYNPAGRLPVTFYATTSDLPPFADYSMANRTYRYFRGKAAYGFGFGLSYSQFTYSDVRLSSKSIKAGEPFTASVQLENNSSRDGDEVVELYLTPPQTHSNPRTMLSGFTRVPLAAHQKRRVSIVVDPRAMSLVDDDGVRAVLPGEYHLSMGGAQPGDSAAQGEIVFHIVGRHLLDR